MSVSAPPALPESERGSALLVHLSPLAGFVLPALGNVLGPLVAWLALRDRSPALDDQGREALNFQLSMVLYGVIIGALAFVLFSLGVVGGLAGTAAGTDLGAFAVLGSLAAFVIFFVPPLLLLSVVPFIFMIVAVVRVSAGQPYRYPLSIRFVR